MKHLLAGIKLHCCPSSDTVPDPATALSSGRCPGTSSVVTDAPRGSPQLLSANSGTVSQHIIHLPSYHPTLYRANYKPLAQSSNRP
jgi:hypothetical protein